MIKVLFWNIKKVNSNNIEFLQSMAVNVDIIILAEVDDPSIHNKVAGFQLVQPIQPIRKKWVLFLEKPDPSRFTIETKEFLFHHRIVATSLKIPSKKPINLIGLHLYSKTNIDNSTQTELNYSAPHEIQNYIKRNGKRCIVVGDFNHNPFDPFMTSKGSFNAIPDKKTIEKIKHTSFKRFPKVLFYNPMWNFLGDEIKVNGASKSSGSYFLKHDFVKLREQL